MAKFMIPQNDAENPVGSGGADTPFPEGTWRGVIEITRLQEVVAGGDSGPTFVLRGEGGSWVGETAEVLAIQLGGITAVGEGQEDVGNRKFFDDLLILRVDENYWDQPSDSEPTWRLDQSRRRLTNLALALGAVETDGASIGPVDHFDEMLRDATTEGEGISGQEVIFEVYHRKFKKKGAEGKDSLGTQALIRQYGSAS